MTRDKYQTLESGWARRGGFGMAGWMQCEEMPKTGKILIRPTFLLAHKLSAEIQNASDFYHFRCNHMSQKVHLQPLWL